MIDLSNFNCGTAAVLIFLSYVGLTQVSETNFKIIRFALEMVIALCIIGIAVKTLGLF